MKRPKPFALIILDGLALNPNPNSNAVEIANTPCLDALFKTCPWTTLCSYGPRVGLPEGQMGNSEVGHLNIGGGRVVEQLLTQIDRTVADGSIADNDALVALCRNLQTKPAAALHLIGLISHGGVHSQGAHFKSLLTAALRRGVKQIYVHGITDGRDCAPDAAISEFAQVQEFLAACRAQFPEATIEIASVIGRYYAMDRDNRWERTELAYRLFTEGAGTEFGSATEAISTAYQEGVTDEFIKPAAIRRSSTVGTRAPVIQSGDALLFFNFRADRMRQIVSSFFRPDAEFTHFERAPLPLSGIASLAEYESDFPLQVLFPPVTVPNHLGKTLSDAGLTQIRAAETEKYAHVTYFFNGGDEEASPGEFRLLVPSKRDVPTYDLVPAMSAHELTERLLEDIRTTTHDIYIVNFANCDMVGHTGVLSAAVQAVETVDACLGQLLAEIAKHGGGALVTADHGNADQMVNYDTGQPHTFHTLYPVPCILVGEDFKQVKLRDGGALCDIAPTILSIVGVPQPQQMTGKSLLETTQS